jgi:transcriptional regulator with XRE-family HTH domain
MRGRKAGALGRGRAEEQAIRIGRQVKLQRVTLGMSRSEVARRARVSDSTVERVEDGDPGSQLNTVVAVTSAVGLDLVLNAYPGQTVSLRDSGQMELAEVIRGAAAAYWHPRLEVAAGEFGRSADMVLYGAEEVVHVEIERAATDFQAQYRSARRKTDTLAAAEQRPIRLVIAVEDTRRNREALRAHADLIRSQLPATTREVMAALRGGRPLGRDGLGWLRRPRRPTR